MRVACAICSTISIDVPAGASVLEAVGTAGVEILSSCRQGICGTCESGVLAGQVQHLDFVLSPEEKTGSQRMLVCVSRCIGQRLVLDL